MKILIVEDEIHIARHLSKVIKSLLEKEEADVKISISLNQAIEHLKNHKIDLLMLDLNLRGKDGFDLLKLMVSKPFHVIVVSAYLEKAIEAFEYGVLDFVPKPFSQERLKKSFNRLKGNDISSHSTIKYFIIKKKHQLIRIREEDVLYFEAYGHYSQMYLKDGRVEFYDKALITLEPLLNQNYARVHKSYIVKMTEFKSVNVFPGGKYSLVMKNNDEIPIGRAAYKRLKNDWFS